MRVLFWGTPEFAVPSLDALLGSPHEVVGLVTQPDRARSRSARLRPPPTKLLLRSRDPSIPVLQPERPSGRAFRERVAALEPDVSVVAAYGNLLPRRVLDLPRLGSLNVHASLLPRHRGAAPVAAAILAGDAETGITLVRMDAGLDTGPILLRRATPIGKQESCGELTARLARLGADVLLEGLALAQAGELQAAPQVQEEATYAPRTVPEAARIRWGDAAAAIERFVRAYDPWPGAFTEWEGKRLKIFRVRSLDAGNRAAARQDDGPAARQSNGPEVASKVIAAGVLPGEVVDVTGVELAVRAGDGTLEIVELQLEGRPRMAAADFAKGRRMPAGTRLG